MEDNDYPTVRETQEAEQAWQVYQRETAEVRYGVVTREGLAGECDECGEWWNPLEQIAMADRDWFLCRSCMATFLLGR